LLSPVDRPMSGNAPFGVDWLSNHIGLFTLLAALLAGLIPATISWVAVPRTASAADLPTSAPRVPMLLGILIGAGIAAFAAFTVAWEDFTFWDNHIFFSGLRGGPQHLEPMINTIAPGIGRFFPLGHQEFGWLSAIDTSGVLYHLFAVAQLVAVCVCAIIITRPKPAVAVLLVLGLVGAEPIMVTFIGLIWPERNTIFLLSFFLVFLIMYLKNAQPFALFLAIAAIAPILLYKETAFIFLAVIGSALTVAYVLPGQTSERAGPRSCQLVAGATLILLAAIFVIYYTAVIRPEIHVSYAAARAEPLSDTLRLIFRQPWSWILTVSLLLRVWLLCWHRVKLDPVWDGLLVAIILYGAAFAVLGFIRPNLISPVVYGAWLYAIRLVTLPYANRAVQYVQRGGLLLLAVCAIVQLGPTWRAMVDRKEIVHAKASAARFVADYAAINGLGKAEKPLILHPLPADHFHAGLFGGFVAAKYDLNVIVAIDSTPARMEVWPCIGVGTPLCVQHLPLLKGELVIPLGPAYRGGDLRGRSDLKRLFRSEDIGFWTNGQFVEVYVVR
jgi:hypothetical protein